MSKLNDFQLLLCLKSVSGLKIKVKIVFGSVLVYIIVIMAIVGRQDIGSKL